MATVIIDTREQIKWDFTFYGFDEKRQKVDAGDYTLEGFEKKIVIERKKSTGELAMNIGKERKRFEKEMVRLQEIERRIIVCEFSINDVHSYPLNSGIPERLLSKIRVSKNYLISSIRDLEENYGVEFYFAGSRNAAMDYVAEVFNKCIMSND